MSGKKYLPSVICLTFIAFYTYASASAAYIKDVPYDHPHFVAIDYLFTHDIVNGYRDGSFQPEKLVNRAEALKIMLLGAKRHVEGFDNVSTNYLDVVTGSWYVRYVRKAQDLGIVEGYSDGTFRPEQHVNLVEALKIILKVYDINVSSVESVKAPYADTRITEWYIPYLQYAKSKNLLDADHNNNIYPNKKLTRAELSDIIYRLIMVRNSNYVPFKQLNIVGSTIIPNKVYEKDAHDHKSVQDGTCSLQESGFYDELQTILNKHHNVIDGEVYIDYVALRDEDLTLLEGFLNKVALVSINQCSDYEKIAFFINAYHSFIIHQAVRQYPNSLSSNSYESFQNKDKTVAGGTYSLEQMKYNVLYPLIQDVRIFFVLNDAAISSPNLGTEIVRPDNMEQLFEEATRTFINSKKAIRIEGDRTYISYLFMWHEEHIGDSKTFILQYLEDPSKRDAINNADRFDYFFNHELNSNNSI